MKQKKGHTKKNIKNKENTKKTRIFFGEIKNKKHLFFKVKLLRKPFF
jgi:hypothetical protein